MLDSAWRDLRHGARLLRLNPGFALVAILSLALGIGANTAIFQLVDAVRLRTLPVAGPAASWSEIRIADTPAGDGKFIRPPPGPDQPALGADPRRQQAFSSARLERRRVQSPTGGEARYAQGLWVSGDFFDTLGVPAAARPRA